MARLQQQKPHAPVWWIVALVAATIFVAVRLRLAPTPTNPAATNSSPTAQSDSGPPARPAASPQALPASRLASAVDRLAAAPNALATRQQLAELRQQFGSMPAAEAVTEMRRFLDSRQDASTRLGFKLASSGFLDEAPTLRTFVLDEMARLDPAAAADYAVTILASKDSPDEWALALRNLARGNATGDGRALLEEKTRELLLHEPWQKEPSIGFLEAFDMAVFLGGTKLMPELSGFVRRQDDPAIAHASFLALDRLVIKDPVTTLEALRSMPDWMQGREETRANYFARADLRDPQQRRILEAYLTNPRLSAAEFESFTGVYPNANFMISPNLMTQNQTLDRGTLVSRDAESLRIVQQWLDDPRFSNRRAALQRLQLRLGDFVRQAAQKQ